MGFFGIRIPEFPNPGNSDNFKKFLGLDPRLFRNSLCHMGHVIKNPGVPGRGIVFFVRWDFPQKATIGLLNSFELELESWKVSSGACRKGNLAATTNGLSDHSQ